MRTDGFGEEKLGHLAAEWENDIVMAEINGAYIGELVQMRQILFCLDQLEKLVGYDFELREIDRREIE